MVYRPRWFEEGRFYWIEHGYDRTEWCVSWSKSSSNLGHYVWKNGRTNVIELASKFSPKGMREVELTTIEVLWYFDHTIGPPCCAKHWWVLSLPQYHLIIHHPPVISPKKVISKDANRLQRTFLNFYFFASLKRLDWLDLILISWTFQ